MGESDGTSVSAASSGADSSSHASSGAEGNPRVDFYVIEGNAPAARLKVACRLAEKAYLASQCALIWHTERTELEALDELLWTFADGSFVPHEWLTSNAQAPVLLSAGATPVAAFDFVVNLAAEPPPFLHLTRRIAEIIDGDEGRRRAGRVRFKAYRELGIDPGTHTLRAE
ncbi:MAG: DNA polymerase III subunit chi [Gammaproteobacteria bacterium]|nr:DNA polymerase III subunit chi [Gammaproteobacteria bacterium]